MSRNPTEENPKSAEMFRIGDFTFSLLNGELRDASGTIVRLRKQSADVLAHLLRRNGAIVAKAALFDAVWGGASVTDDSLVQCISEIRRSIGDRQQVFVRTVSKRGYVAHADPIVSDRSPPDLARDNRPSIAILAFNDYSAGDDKDHLSDAIAEGVIAGLSRFTELSIVARNTSFSLRDTSTPAAEIAKKLKVDYLLEGSQQKSGDHLRVTAQLIDAKDERHIWSETYDQKLDNLFGVQDDIVRRVVAMVAQKVIRSEALDPSGPHRTALSHHLEGRQHHFRFTPEANEQARLANLAAIEVDANQPYGYVGLSFVYINGYRWGWSPLCREDALREARRMAQKAIELAPDYYDGYAAMAYVHLEDQDLDRAIACAERALKLNPNDTNVMCDLADLLGYAGRTEEAEALLQTAMRLDPLHPDWIRWNMAWIQWLSGKYDKALITMNSMSETPPMANRVLAIICVSLGRLDEGRAAVQRLRDFNPGYSMTDVRRDYAGKFRNEDDLDRVTDCLRVAGLPG